MADSFKPLQAQQFTLAGAGTSIGATSITLSSMATIDGVAITMSDIGAIGYFTTEPGSGTQEEAGTFTGITQNVNGTATLTGVKHQLFEYPYTQSSGLTKSHAGGTTLILSNTAGFYESISGKANDETVTGIWTFTAPNYPRMDSAAVPPVTDTEFATKKYVDDTAIAGSPKATDAVYGISKLSVAAVSAVAPIAVGDNDNRVSPVSLAAVTADKVAALAGTGTPNGTTGKYVTNDDTSATASNDKVVRYGAGAMLKASTTAASVAGDVIALDAAAKLPAVDGSQLTNKNKLLVSGTPVSTKSTNSAQTLFTTTLTGGLLSTNNGVEIIIPLSDIDFKSDSKTCNFILNYGATPIAGVTVSTSGTSFENANGFIRAYLLSTGATNTQRGVISVNADRSKFVTSADTQAGPAINYYSSGTATEDSSANKTISITTTNSVDDANFGVITDGYIAKLIN
jgi:hypothetical protein